jgi:hypothetical protein
MSDKSEPWYDDAAAALEFSKALVPLMQDRDRLPALRNKGLKLFKDIAGIYLLPANKEGERKDGIPKDFDARLRRAGLDPRTGRLTDPVKWELALIELRQKKEEQQRLKELKERKETIAEVVKGFQPPKLKTRPKTANVQDFLYNDFQNRRIAREIRKAQEEDGERASLKHYNRSGHKYYPPVQENDSPGWGEGIKMHDPSARF